MRDLTSTSLEILLPQLSLLLSLFDHYSELGWWGFLSTLLFPVRYFVHPLTVFSLCHWGFKKTDFINYWRVRVPPRGVSLDTKLHLMVSLQFCRSGEWRELFNWDYFKVHSDLAGLKIHWLYPQQKFKTPPPKKKQKRMTWVWLECIWCCGCTSGNLRRINYPLIVIILRSNLTRICSICLCPIYGPNRSV